jgi:hypothetical protein
MPRKKVQKEGDATQESQTADALPSRMPRMSAPERGFMIDWLFLDRPGEGKGMLNFRWIYGGAAKGQNMNGDASDVHASSGYLALANYVNDKAKIKSKAGAWDADAAEKRWTTMKATYRKALNLPKPNEEGNDNFVEEMGILIANREAICADFERLFALLGEHPATAPVHTIDSMTRKEKPVSASSPVDGDDDDDEKEEDADLEDNESEVEAPENFPEAEQLKDDATVGSKRSRTNTTVASAATPKNAPKEPKLSKQRQAEKKPFHLKKATSEPSHKRTDIQTMFIKSQEDLAKNQHQQMRINAMLELLKAKIPQADIPGMMAFMFGEPEKPPTTTTIYHGDNEKTVITHTSDRPAL